MAQPSPNYTLNSLSNATAIIRDQPVDDWRKLNFTAGELGTPAISGDLANPDGDSLANLMEYALGLPPKSANGNAFAPRIESGYFTLTYTLNKAATDVALVLEKSDTLGSWQNNPALFQEVSRADLGLMEEITVRLVAPVGATATYVRLKATRL